MANQRRVGILHCFEQAVGHLGWSLVEVGVNTGDDNVHLLEHRVGEIKRAVGQDIHFDAGKNS